MKIEDGQGSRLVELAKEYYVISTSVTGTMGAGRGRQEEQGRSDPDFSRMQETMLEVTTLKVKGKDPLAPAKIEVIPSAGGMTTLVLFPRTRAISPDDKEVNLQDLDGTDGDREQVHPQKHGLRWPTGSMTYRASSCYLRAPFPSASVNHTKSRPRWVRWI